ncbi:hypothetical protein [Compostibacter hankyongensis]|uniref:Lipocalin-like domain-containing protein n=1 Tax=Compostibacter hankyongensis TaxID=1007089 RepID=A0ABP8FPA3_9BACT
MKKALHLISAALVTAVIFSSCATQMGTTGNSGITMRSLTGNWVISDIRFEGIPDGSKVTLFDEAAYPCFKGSSWNLKVNGDGSYTLQANPGCNAVTQQIIWSVEGGQFQFKKMEQGVKPKDIATGYRVNIASLEGNMMTWKAAVDVEGQQASIIYTLQRQ